MATSRDRAIRAEVEKAKAKLHVKTASSPADLRDLIGRLEGRKLSPQRIFDLRGEKFRAPSRSLSKDKKKKGSLVLPWKSDSKTALISRKHIIRKESVLEKNIKELHENLCWKSKVGLYEATIEKLCCKVRHLKQENKRLKMLVGQIRHMESRIQQESVIMYDSDKKRRIEPPAFYHDFSIRYVKSVCHAILQVG